MYNFNEFCKSKECKYHREFDMQVGKCHSCIVMGVTINIIKYPEGCLHLEDITIAKDKAKQQDIMWKKLNQPHRTVKSLLRDPVHIQVL